MEPVLYFYSIDGTNTFGPVTRDALRQLLKDRVIRPVTLICQQGETEWQRVDLDWLRRVPEQTPRLPSYEPPPYVPTGKAKEREEELAQKLEKKWDEGPCPGLFKWGCVAFSLIATIILAALQDGIQNIVAGLLAGVVFTALIPYLIVLPVGKAWKWRAWAMAMVIVTALTFITEKHYARLMRIAEAMTVPSAQARAADSAEEMGRMVQAMQPVQQEMIDKVKASDLAEKACGNFDPALLTTQADLNKLRDGINSLRAAQGTVLTYFQSYDDRCRTALASGNFSADGIERFVAVAHQSAHIDQAVSIWQLRIKLTDDHLARLDFLDKHWGNWQPKDGQLLFTNQADLDSYNQLTQNLVIDIKQGNALQNQTVAR